MNKHQLLENLALKEDENGSNYEILFDNILNSSMMSCSSFNRLLNQHKNEDTFKITMEMDDIIDFSSYDVGINLLKKYNIDII